MSKYKAGDTLNSDRLQALIEIVDVNHDTYAYTIKRIVNGTMFTWDIDYIDANFTIATDYLIKKKLDNELDDLLK